VYGGEVIHYVQNFAVGVRGDRDAAKGAIVVCK
jgi:hypothetical protein